MRNVGITNTWPSLGRLFVVLLTLPGFLCACQNPLGDSDTESAFVEDTGSNSTTADTEAPTAPSSLSFSGNSSFTTSPTLNWSASTDNTAVSYYQVALGTSSGGEQVETYQNIGSSTSYQYTGLSPNLSSNTLYYVSVRAVDEAGNTSEVAASTFYAPGLLTSSGSYQFPDSTYATNCLGYLNSAYYNTEGTGLYWIDHDGDGGDSEISVYCNMDRDGGGWTLVANRQIQGSNVEDCQSDLDTFFQNTCGSASSITSGDSYSIGDTTVRDNINTNGEWLFLQYDNTDTADTDDAFIITKGDTDDLFFTSTGTLNRTSVTQVCDIDNDNCDTTDVEWLWAGDGYFSSSRCNSGHTANGGTYYGNYGYCHNGNANYSSNSLFGNRDGYNETKLWGHPSGGGSYYERIYIR